MSNYYSAGGSNFETGDLADVWFGIDIDGHLTGDHPTFTTGDFANQDPFVYIGNKGTVASPNPKVFIGLTGNSILRIDNNGISGYDVSQSVWRSIWEILEVSGDDLGNHIATQILDMSGYQITGLAAPTGDQDAVNKVWLSGNYSSGNHTHDADYPSSGSFAALSGDYVITSGDYAKSSGDYATTSGDYAALSGDYTATSGDFSALSGDYLITSGNYVDTSGDFSTHIGNADAHHTEYTDALARAAINNIFGSDGKADSDIDLDSHKLIDVSGIISPSTTVLNLYASGALNLKASNDDDDFIQLTTVSNTPYLNIKGGAQVYLTSDDSNNVSLMFYDSATHYGFISFQKTDHYFNIYSKDPIYFRPSGDSTHYIKATTENGIPQFNFVGSQGKITNLKAPTGDQDAATKGWTDNNFATSGDFAGLSGDWVNWGYNITGLSGFSNSVVYTDSNGLVKRLSFGTSGTYLMSQGPSTPPSWANASGAGGSPAIEVNDYIYIPLDIRIGTSTEVANYRLDTNGDYVEGSLYIDGGLVDVSKASYILWVIHSQVSDSNWQYLAYVGSQSTNNTEAKAWDIIDGITETDNVLDTYIKSLDLDDWAIAGSSLADGDLLRARIVRDDAAGEIRIECAYLKCKAI